MNQSGVEQNLVKYLPSRRRLVRDVVIMLAFAGLGGPLLGPFILGFVNPAQSWGAAGAGNYSVGSVMVWGLAFVMIEAILYAGWLVSRIHKGRDEGRSSSRELH